MNWQKTLLWITQILTVNIISNSNSIPLHPFDHYHFLLIHLNRLHYSFFSLTLHSLTHYRRHLCSRQARSRISLGFSKGRSRSIQSERIQRQRSQGCSLGYLLWRRSSRTATTGRAGKEEWQGKEEGWWVSEVVWLIENRNGGLFFRLSRLETLLLL